MLVERILPVARERLVTISDHALLSEAARLLSDRHTNLVVVCNDNGVMVGVITKTDVVRRIGQCHGNGCRVAVATVMIQDVTHCTPNDQLEDIWSIMKDRGLLHIPVLDQDSKPLGVIYIRDALLALLGEVEREEILLRDYVMGVGYQ